VRVSGEKLTEAVGWKGSGFKVTDSKAMARVEAESLIRTGAVVGLAARRVFRLPQMAIRQANLINIREVLEVHCGRPIVIGVTLHQAKCEIDVTETAKCEVKPELILWEGRPE
jgi:hypothetical protein